MIRSQLKLRVREQIWFMKTCIKEELTTQRVWKMTDRLNLQRNQAATLRKTIMKNLRKELYQKMAGLNREMSQKKEEVRELLNADDFATLKLCEQQETNYAKQKLRKHYQDRRRWIKEKTRERRVKELPKEIDGIRMEDQELDERFNANIRK